MQRTDKSKRRPGKFVTLNYSLSKELSAQLESYCDRTGRTASEVVRQLILEFVEDDRTIATVATSHGDGRSSMRLRSGTLQALDARIEAAGLPSKSLVIESLLRDFLARSPRPEERLIVQVPLPVEIVRVCADLAAIRGVKLAEFVAEVVAISVRPEPVKAKES